MMKYLASLLVLGLFVVFTASLAESNLRESLVRELNSTIGGNDLQKNVSCLVLCDYCGCDGSFAGDECICDCINDGDKHIKCLEELKNTEKQYEFEELQESVEQLLAGAVRVRRDISNGDLLDGDSSMLDRGTASKASRKNKRKKFNRRQRGRRFLQRNGSN
ncbi:hypothetical protein quinque_003191 [Culex quinquefasciatus]|uniref:uncharacterized protein LOC6045674 n=1 Tax=Culex quinquefasciatus TaxID=7176 RepID=UPI0018E3EC72|nr:uncharacterized protein LOC6045674 [Culex quinquefasciatus]